MAKFPNKAGDHADTDEILRAELKAAGIQTLQEAAGKPPEFMAALLREQSCEVKTSVRGVLHGWTFIRGWYYWMANGPGIEVEAAERLHAVYGTEVRVDGHCGCPSPRERYKGLACGHYHVDTPEGLRALANAIRALVGETPMQETKPCSAAPVVTKTSKKMKYVRHSVVGFILWPATDDLWHLHVGDLVGRKAPGRILSAGFVMIANGKVRCYGESESLGIKSLYEDSADLAEQLGLESDVK